MLAPVCSATPTVVNQSNSLSAPALVIPATLGTPLSVKPFSLPEFGPPIAIPDLSNLLAQLSYVVSQINVQLASPSGTGSNFSILTTRNELVLLKTQIQSDLAQALSLPVTIASYNCGVNTQLNSLTSQINKAIADYYAQDIAVENALYAAAQKSAAALIPKPAPAVTVTAYATVTATPDPTVNQVGTSPIIKSGGIIKKSITCVKTVGGKTTTKIVKGFIVSCPPGFAIPKGQSSFSLVKK